MTAGRVVLWRHGQTEYNATNRVQGGVDVALNETGRAQAREGAQELADYLVRPPALIVASDLSRAAETAGALAEIVGTDVVPDERLRERRFGIWEGLTRAEMEERWAEKYALWRSGGTPEGVGMESHRSVADRAAGAVRDHADGLDAGDVLVVVGHGAALMHAVVTLIGLDAEVMRPLRGLDNCHWSELGHLPDRDPEWQLRAHNVGARGGGSRGV